VTDPETGETIEEEFEKLPYIVIIVDELADLMAVMARSGGRNRPVGANGPGGWHPSDYLNPATFGGSHHRPDQSQHYDAHSFSGGDPD